MREATASSSPQDLPRILSLWNTFPTRRSLQFGFEAYGFEVIAASDGSDALRQFQGEDGDFEAILIDHDLPDLNGVEFAKTVRTLGFTGRILIVSSDLSVSDLRAYQDHQISGIFSKPFEFNTVANLLLAVD